MSYPNLTRLGAPSIGVNEKRNQILPIVISVGIQYSKQNRWAPNIPYGPTSPIIYLSFDVKEMRISTYKEYDTTGEDSRMDIDLIGNVSANEVDLVPFGDNVVGILEFFSDKSMRIRVRHEGQPSNHSTYFKVEIYDIDELYYYLLRTDHDLLRFLPDSPKNVENLEILPLLIDKLKVEDVDVRYREERLERRNPYYRAKTVVKRTLNSTRLRLGSYSEDYLQLMSKIKNVLVLEQGERFRSSTSYDTLQKATRKVIVDYLSSDDISKFFAPSYESKNKSLPKKMIDPEVARQLTIGFFEAKEITGNKTLSDYEQDRLKKAQQFKAENPTRTATNGYELRKSQMIIDDAELKTSTKDIKAWASNFKSANDELLKRFARDAIESFFMLPDAKERPLLNIVVTLTIQEVDPLVGYNPIVKIIHTDSEFDLFKDGQRYGRPAHEQDVSSIVSSFCSNLYVSENGTKQAILDRCGTVYFDGIPYVTSDAMENLVERLKSEFPSVTRSATEYELISALGSVISSATTSALETYSEEQLKDMGIVAKESAMLQWTNVNALTFHRSALLDEVYANALPRQDGTYFPRMRAFCVVLGDFDVATLDTDFMIEMEYMKDGRKIPVSISVRMTPAERTYR